MKKLLPLIFLFVASASPMDRVRAISDSYARDRQDLQERIMSTVSAPSSIGELKAYYNGKDFFVEDDNAAYQVPRHRLDPMLKNLSSHQMKSLLASVNLYASKNDAGEYSLDAEGRLQGGGVGGANAGFWIGKVGTHIVCHGVIHAIAWFSGPAYPIVAKGLHSGLALPIEKASCVVALGCGILGGLITGPV